MIGSDGPPIMSSFINFVIDRFWLGKTIPRKYAEIFSKT